MTNSRGRFKARLDFWRENGSEIAFAVLCLVVAIAIQYVVIWFTR